MSNNYNRTTALLVNTDTKKLDTFNNRATAIDEYRNEFKNVPYVFLYMGSHEDGWQRAIDFPTNGNIILAKEKVAFSIK